MFCRACPSGMPYDQWDIDPLDFPQAFKKLGYKPKRRYLMRTPKIYLETTIFNFYFDSDRDAHADTVTLFKEIQAGKYEAYTSIYTTDELVQADEPKRSKMLSLITENNIKVLSADDEAMRIADIYVKEGISP